MLAALELAERFAGATAPNPPVGASAYDPNGVLLGVAAHERAGAEHAEALLIRILREKGLSDRIHRIEVTLEPCNHRGKTPPCCDALLALPSLKQVRIGSRDPNRHVLGGGLERLKAAGLHVELVNPDTEEGRRCRDLIAPFAFYCATGFPYVTVKTALDRSGSMYPPRGKKTFTSQESLTVAHELRRRADAYLTGSGTVLADDPLFTVRLVTDHPDRARPLLIADRRHRVPESWLARAEARGLKPRRITDWVEALRQLGEEGCREVLVEAGPELSQAVLASGHWNRHVIIRQGNPADVVEVKFAPPRELESPGQRRPTQAPVQAFQGVQ